MNTQGKTVLSFYCDDTGPYVAGARAFELFLDFCEEQGVAGESSFIPGTAGRSMVRDPSAEESAFLKQVRRAHGCGIDTHMELMTHGGLFDFARNAVREGAPHEGVWLHEPGVPAEEFESYFAAVLAEGDAAGCVFSGLTLPGCACETCSRRYAELRAQGITEPGPAVWEALLRLAERGRFRGRMVPCFISSSDGKAAVVMRASRNGRGVCRLEPNAGDYFGIWANDPRRVDPDYYITADGKAGVIVDAVNRGAPTCLWYAHWQGLNPVNGVGWPAFTEVVARIRRHLSGRTVWMRPGDIASA